MKIFVLEDNAERISLLQRELPKIFVGAQVFYSETADDGKKVLLKEQPFDILLLDHDLGGKVFVNSHDHNTGYQVAIFVRENNIPYQIAIAHTMNPAGGENIVSVLPKSIHIPFPILLSYLKGLDCA